MKNNLTSTLLVDIDVSSKTNVVCALDYKGNKLLKMSAGNNLPGANSIAASIISCFIKRKLFHVVVALESTSFYGLHIAHFLSSHDELLFFSPLVYCLNPKSIANYRKSFVDIDKTDPLDAFIIVDFARVGRIQSNPGEDLNI
jgi:transposase